MNNGRKEASYLSVATVIGLLATAIGGGMYVGALAQEVETLSDAREQATEDHDRLILVEQSVEYIKTDVSTIKSDLKKILEAVNKLEKEDKDGDG